jgi:tetratricopeptide repeat protein
VPSDADPSEAEPPAGHSKARAHAQQRFDRAARLESKDPRAALAIYHSLARGRGPWAANALYAEARLELELDHPQRAERLLRRYLSRHPRGLNAPDVRKLLERIEP